MKLPNQVWLKPRIIYEVVYQDQIGDDPKTIGYCDDETKHLYIKTNLTKEEEEDTSLHELIHAVDFRYKLKIPHKTLDKLATALLKVCKLNGWTID